MTIIGLTGTFGAGKSTAVDYLVNKYGFAHYSARKFITEELEKREMVINRDTMTEIANEMREKNGPAYVVEKLYEKAEASGKNAIIESIRTVGEIDFLKSKGPFYLFAVDADPQIRYERVYKRKSETDNVSFDKFLDDEKREMMSDDPNKQNIITCVSKADVIFRNEDGLDELKNEIDNTIAKLALAPN